MTDNVLICPSCFCSSASFSDPEYICKHDVSKPMLNLPHGIAEAKLLRAKAMPQSVYSCRLPIELKACFKNNHGTSVP